MIPAVVLALANLVPAILPLITKDETAIKATEAVTKVATAVAGTNSVEDAAKVILGDALKVEEFQRSVLEHTAEMYKLETERLEAEVKDRISAREMYVSTKDPAQGWIAGAVLVVWAFIQIWLIVKGLPEGVSESIIQRALGILDAVVLAIIGFYFGSSLGSKMKTEAGIGVSPKK